MRGTLISIDAWNRSTASRQTVRVGAALNSTTLGVGGYTWEPRLSRRPRLSMQLADDDLTGTVQLGQGEFALNAAALRFPDSAAPIDPMQLDWIGSTLRIYSGDGYTLSDMRQEFAGRVVGGVTDATTGIAPLTIEVDKAIVDVALLTQTYGGGGGADGDVELRGNFKPAGFGSPINIRPVLVNETLNIYQVDAYNNTKSIAAVFEDAASFGASAGDYATYAALAAATVKEGQWATCIAEGLFRLGADPTGTITCDPVFGADMPGSMMMRWLTVHAGIAIGRIRDDTFDALTAAVKAVAGQDPYVDYWTTEEGNILELMQRMCASCNAVVLLLLDGTIAVSRAIGGPVVMTLNRQGGSPTVTDWAAGDQPRPWWRMRMTAARSYYVNSPAEIDYEDDVRDMGDYSASETYRQGMVARGSDGARYIYKNATPSSGNAPPNAAYWDIYEDAPDATTIKYPSGYTLAQLEPGEKGANVTETRVSSSITGQGAFATLNTAAYGSGYLTGFGQLSPLNSITFGGNYLFESGGILATLNAFKTILGIASGISGQGAFATKDSVGYGSSFLTGFGALSPLNNILFGSSFLQESAGVSATLSNFKTILGVAASITGQGGLATKSIIGNGELGANVITLDKLGAIGDVTNLAVNGRPTANSNWGGTSFIADDPTNAYGGARFVFKGEAGANTRYNGNSNTIPLTPGEKLFMAWMGRVDAAITAGAARPYLRVNNKDGGQIGTPSVGQLQVGTAVGSWIQFSGEITIPDNAVSGYMQINFGNTEGGTAFISDIVLLRKNAASLLVNAGVLQQYLAGNAVRLGTNVVRADNATAVTDATAITSLGTASGIAGQGAFATLNSAAYGSNLLTGFGALAPLAAVTFGSNFLLETAGTPATLAAFKTIQGTAAGITGQGSLATKSTVGSGDLGAGSVLPSRLGTISGGNNVIADPTFLDTGYWQLNGGGATVVFDTDATACAALGVQKAIKWTGDDATGTTTAYPGAPANRGQSFPCTGGELLVISFDYYVAVAGPAGTGQLKLNLGVRRRDGSMQYFSAGVTTGGLAAGAKGVATQRAKLPDDAVAYSAYFEWQLQPNIARTGTVYAAAPFVGTASRLGFSLLREDGTTSLTDSTAVTSLGTASGIAGQGAFATLNSAAYGSSLLTGFAALAAQPSVMFGSSFLLESAGTSATLARFRTADGTAAAISGQGAFATINSASYGSALLTGFGGLAGDSLVKLGSSGKTFREDGTTRLTDATAVTSLGTASGIAGQGTFATQSQLNLDNGSFFVQPDRFAGLRNGDGRYFRADSINFDSTDGFGGNYQNLASLRPGEANANVTENRTASAISGQSVFATLMSGTSLDNSVFGMPSRLGAFDGLLSASNMAYRNNGLAVVSVDSLRPAQFGSDVTSTNVAASITGQGTGATASSLAGLNATEGSKLAGIQDRATYGDNLIPGAQTLEPTLWNLSGDVTRIVGATGEPAFYFRMGNGGRAAANNGVHMPIKTPGSRHFIEVTARANGVGDTRLMRVELNYKRATGNGVYAGFATRTDNTFQIGSTTFALYRMYFDVPLDWVSVLVVFTSTQNVAGAYVDVGTVSLSASQAGSDSTEINPKMLTIDRGSTRGENLIRNSDYRDLSPVTGLPSHVVSVSGTTQFVPPAGAVTGYYENTQTAGSDTLAFNAGSPVPVNAFSTDWPIFEAGQKVFASAEVATSGARRVQLVARAWTAAGAAASPVVILDFTVDTAGAWVVRKAAPYTMPAGYVYLQFYMVLFTTVGTYTRVRNVRLARVEDAATLGADANTNIIDGGNGNVLLTRTQLVTALGVAQAVTGQGALATSTLTAAQVTNTAISISAAGVLSGAGGGTVTYAGVGGKALGLQDRIYYGQSYLYEESSFSTIATLANFKTSAGTAAAIAGQGALATKSTADYGTDVTGAGKPDTYRIMARGNAVSSPPAGFVVGLTRGDGSGVWTFYARSYSVVWYDRAAKTWNGRNFDVYGSSQDYGFGTGDANTGPTAMATYLNNIAAGSPVVVYSSDEPRTNRMNGGLPAAMYRCGASRSTFGAGNWRNNGAYILIGMAGAGEGNASSELYYDAGADGSPASFQMAAFNMVDGRIPAGARAINTADELAYSNGVTVGARQPQEAGANITENRTASAIAGQAWAATSGTQDRADNQRVAVGSNGLIDTEFAQGNALWQPIWAGSSGAPVVQRGVNFQADANNKFYGANSVLWMLAQGTPTSGTATELAASGPSEDPRYFVPVRPGDNVYASAYLAAHRSQGQVNIHWYNAAGSYLTENAWDGGKQDGGQNGDPVNFDRIGGFITAPTNAAFACLRIRHKYTGGQGPYLFAMRPQITVCAPGQTTPPPYVPGNGDKRADRTGGNTAAGIAGQGAFATMNSAAFGSPQLTGFGNIAGLGNITFGDDYLLETAGTRATNANYKTIVGTSAGITGQGSFATKSVVSMNSNDIVDRYASNLFYGSDGANTGSVQSLRPGEAGANITENRTASAISGQGAFATVQQITRANIFQQSLFSLNAFSLGYTVTREDGTTKVTESMAITSLGIASAVTNQGSLATMSSVSTGQIGANAVTAPAWMAVDYGGGMGSFPLNTWTDYDTATGGGGGGVGGGSGGGGGGTTRNVNLA